MTFDELTDFVEHRMSMSHIYQPLLIRSLVDAGGTATLRQLAQSFLAQDESQLRFYEQRVKEMPLRILHKHGVVRHQGSLVTLDVPTLSFEQKARIRMLCEQRLQQFVERRGLAIWDYRLLETDPVPDNLRYQALKAAGGRCALCGATKHDRPLDVDHIIPRSRGGKNTLANLQVLCTKCNRTKSNKDTTDFRSPLPPESDPTCAFCPPIVTTAIIAKNGTVVALRDGFPASPGHILVIPRRHTTDYFSMTAEERTDADALLRVLRNEIQMSDPQVTGFNVGANCGADAGQTVMHAHLHLIPRRPGDALHPRGGVRGCIPTKMSY